MAATLPPMTHPDFSAWHVRFVDDAAFGDYARADVLQAYRSGQREHALMSSQAKELTDQQIADLAAYYGSRDGQLADLNGVTLESQRAAN